MFNTAGPEVKYVLPILKDAIAFKNLLVVCWIKFIEFPKLTFCSRLNKIFSLELFLNSSNSSKSFFEYSKIVLFL